MAAIVPFSIDFLLWLIEAILDTFSLIDRRRPEFVPDFEHLSLFALDAKTEVAKAYLFLPENTNEYTI